MQPLIQDAFRGRTAVIATQHGKETVIAPVLERELGLKCIVPASYDTDALGTFTGEVERPHDPLTTARMKCLGAMDLTGSELGIASEGSFGPAPGAFFLPCDEEWLIMVDRTLQLEIVVRERTFETNFSGAVIHSLDELLQFAKDAQFPGHGLILRRSRMAYDPVFKGIHDPEQLKALYTRVKETDGSCFVETDMRALHNPTRMQVIHRLAQQLSTRAATPCPACSLPGFGSAEAVPGLPCSLCSLPTRQTLLLRIKCSGCGFVKEQIHPEGILVADPAICNYCNP